MNKTNEVLILGSIALDTIETKFGKKENLLGGSATYATIGAGFYGSPIPIGIVGDDFPKQGDEIFNIGYGKQVGLMEFITEIEKNLGRVAEKNFLPMHPADSKETWSDTSKLYNLTGYNPKTSVVDGVKEFIDWYKSYYKVN